MNRKSNSMIILILLLTLMSTRIALAQDTKTTNSGYFASSSESLLDKAMDYAAAKDYVALQKLLDSGLVFSLQGGIQVHVVDIRIFSGKVKVRAVGEMSEFWTLSEGIR